MPNKRGPETPIEPDMAPANRILPLPDPRKREGKGARQTWRRDLTLVLESTILNRRAFSTRFTLAIRPELFIKKKVIFGGTGSGCVGKTRVEPKFNPS